MQNALGAKMESQRLLEAARVPQWVKPQAFGPWILQRVTADAYSDEARWIGWHSYTLLRRKIPATVDNMQHADEDGMVLDVVMEDSQRELRKHLPILMSARGRVLVTGLGLGCVVRGLLAKPDVEEIHVVENDDDILRVIGPEFARNPRVTLYHADAMHLTFPAGTKFDFAWHDIWTPGNKGLQMLHAALFADMRKHVPLHRQGAWAFPRDIHRQLHIRFLGAPRTPRNKWHTHAKAHRFGLLDRPHAQAAE